MPDLSDVIVKAHWLAQRLDAPDLRLIDASWYLPQAGRDAKAEYEAAHLPGAVFVDIDALSDPKSPLPHMLPPSEMFSSRWRKLGIGDGARVIVYDGAGIFSAPRVWWMGRVMGLRDIAVLDGGLPLWRTDNLPLSDDPPRPRERHLTVRFDNTLVRDRDQMVANLTSAREQVLDARSAGRFHGREPEPRPGLRGGHIPGAINVPFDSVLNPNGTMKEAAELRSLFIERGVDLAKPIIAMCGSGVTACILALALARLNHRQVAVYDGSWAEWGADPSLPLAT